MQVRRDGLLRRGLGNVVLEMLETRLALSVSVTTGDGTLRIIGDDAGQNLVIVDQHRGPNVDAVVWLDADGDGTFTEAGDMNGVSVGDITSFDIRLAGGNDGVQFRLGDQYAAAGKSLSVRLGRGNDAFVFETSLGEAILGTNLAIQVSGGGGDDTAAVLLNHVRSSSVTASVDLGAGNDRATFTASGDVADSAVAVNAVLGSGDDVLDGTLDWEGLDILGTSGRLTLNVNGGDGNDTLQLTGIASGPGAIVQGLLDVTLDGATGTDSVNADVGTLNMDGGTVRVRTLGGAGNDQTTASAAAGPLMSR